jgi:hypothetical protein
MILSSVKFATKLRSAITDIPYLLMVFGLKPAILAITKLS